MHKMCHRGRREFDWEFLSASGVRLWQVDTGDAVVMAPGLVFFRTNAHVKHIAGESCVCL